MRLDRHFRQLADEQLMVLVAGDDAAAFGLLYDRHRDAAYSLAYRMCGERALAEDVVQEAFISLWRSAPNYHAARGSVRGWVLRIVHNRGVDALRRSIRRDRLFNARDEEIAERLPATERTEEEVERREQADTVRSALAGLPGEQRKAIELAYFSGLSHLEIAEMLQVPIGTVKGRIRLGLRKLRRSLLELQEQEVL